MSDPNIEEGVVRDMGATRVDDDQDRLIDGSEHRTDQGFIGVRLPKKPRRPKRHRKHRHSQEKPKIDITPALPSDPKFFDPATLSPSEQIQALITDNEDESHDVFCQLDTLFKLGNEMQWREAARWVKYEEDVEDSGNRWSKPHVASLSLHSLFELRSQLLNGAMMLDVDAYHISQVADLLIDNLIANKLLEDTLRDDIKQAILSAHIHAHLKRRKTQADDLGRKKSIARTFSEIGRSFSKTNTRDVSGAIKGNPNSVPDMAKLQVNGDLKESPSSAKLSKHHHHHQLNQPFMKKIPDGAEAANIWVGELDSLRYPITAFIRLTEARTIGDLTEVPLPTRFIFLHLGPSGSSGKCLETGRAMSTVMVDEVFREVAYKAKTRQDILTGIDEFLDQVTVLPPGEWDPKIRIEPPTKVPSQQARKENKAMPAGPKEAEVFIQEEENHCDPTLVRSGRLFGGLIADIKRKLPWYASDFKDCLHMQCIASIIYLYLATLTPNVTFGGLLGLATNNYMGTMECILTAALTGILFALFSGQPLNILGSTGPMLVLEMIIYNICDEQGWDFLPLRAWVGLWSAFILLIVVAFDLSALVKYITRFTEESFACLIAVIFIVEAFKKLFAITDKYPYNIHPDIPLDYNCTCYDKILFEDTNITMVMNSTTAAGYAVIDNMATTVASVASNATNMTVVDFSMFSKKECKKNGGILIGTGCDTIEYHDNVFFLSILLFLFTFGIAWVLKMAKTSRFFPTIVRQYLSDFAVLLSILIMVMIDFAIGVPTPKLKVPEKFEPSNSNRGWFINPFSPKNPWWTTLMAAGPAVVAVILIFMDQQITAVIVNRKENKLKKGNGYHLDLLVVTICIIACSLLGLPWYVAATVSALAHIMSLKVESESAAPGEKPMFLGCREQRVTALMVGILSGLSVFMTSILKIIPMPVLYGVFLYMGVAALKGMQLTDRVLILLMPAKYQPDLVYLRHVKAKRVHLFTFIQILCLAILWGIKVYKKISIVFPMMVVGTCFVRKGMEKIFSMDELKWLDDLMPDDSKKKKEDAMLNSQDDDEEIETDSLLGAEKRRLQEMKKAYDQGDKFGIRVPQAQDRVNITEEVNKTGIWLQVRRDSMPVIRDPDQSNGNVYNRKKDRSRKVSSEKTSFFISEDDKSPLREEHEDDMV